MIRSMTGYGRAQAVIDGRDILVEIRSVNHRYYEFSSRLPRVYGYLDEKLKSYLQGKISRGKVETTVTIVNIEQKDILVAANTSVAKGYVDALRRINMELGLEDDLSLSNLLRLQDIFTIQKSPEDEETIWSAVREVTAEALEHFITMRANEGENLKLDILDKLSGIDGLVSSVEKISPQLVVNYRRKLFNKLNDILSDTSIDEQRILTEAAIYAEKIAVDEETVRLHSHIAQFRELLESENSVGRKLDFLVQEMNREANTIGSKAQDINVTRLAVDIKSEIEKIREQIQNIE